MFDFILNVLLAMCVSLLVLRIYGAALKVIGSSVPCGLMVFI